MQLNLFKWQVFENGKWNDHQWSLTEKEKVAKHFEMVKNMKPGVLYYPTDLQFRADDFVKKSQEDKKKQAIAYK